MSVQNQVDAANRGGHGDAQAGPSNAAPGAVAVNQPAAAAVGPGDRPAWIRWANPPSNDENNAPSDVNDPQQVSISTKLTNSNIQTGIQTKMTRFFTTASTVTNVDNISSKRVNISRIPIPSAHKHQRVMKTPVRKLNWTTPREISINLPTGNIAEQIGDQLTPNLYYASTPKRRREPSWPENTPSADHDNTLTILQQLENSPTMTAPKRTKFQNERTPLEEYNLKVLTEMANLDTIITRAKITRTFAQIVTNTDSEFSPIQGFAEARLPPDVVDTWLQHRSDSADSGKNTIRGEWLQESARTKTVEPWAAGIERVPSYLLSDPKFAAKAAELREETALKLMEFAGELLIKKAEVQKKAAARNLITVNNAILENNPIIEDADTIQQQAKSAVEKVVARDVNREMKFFNDKALKKYTNKVSNHDLVDPCNAVMRLRGMGDTQAPERRPFQERASQPRGQRPRGRGPRRDNRGYGRRGRYQPY